MMCSAVSPSCLRSLHLLLIIIIIIISFQAQNAFLMNIFSTERFNTVVLTPRLLTAFTYVQVIDIQTYVPFDAQTAPSCANLLSYPVTAAAFPPYSLLYCPPYKYSHFALLYSRFCLLFAPFAPIAPVPLVLLLHPSTACYTFAPHHDVRLDRVRLLGYLISDKRTIPLDINKQTSSQKLQKFRPTKCVFSTASTCRQQPYRSKVKQDKQRTAYNVTRFV